MIFIGLGSNLGDPELNLERAMTLLEAGGARIIKRSSFYYTAPWGIREQPSFINAVVQVSTTLKPIQVMQLALETERRMGRVRGEKWGPRVIDLDLLAYGDVFLRSSILDVPHPRIEARAFVLAPWAEIAPSFRPPNSNSTVAELYAALDQDVRNEAKRIID